MGKYIPMINSATQSQLEPRNTTYIYYLDAGTKEVPEQANVAIKIKNKYTWAEWHRRLGHIGITGLQHLHTKNLVDGLSIEDSTKDLECDTCIQAKQTRAPSLKW
jgi:hypothetical protein